MGVPGRLAGPPPPGPRGVSKRPKCRTPHYVLSLLYHSCEKLKRRAPRPRRIPATQGRRPPIVRHGRFTPLVARVPCSATSRAYPPPQSLAPSGAWRPWSMAALDHSRALGAPPPGAAIARPSHSRCSRNHRSILRVVEGGLLPNPEAASASPNPARRGVADPSIIALDIPR